MCLSTKEDVKTFLTQVKEVINKINGFHFVGDRQKNIDSLDKHGLRIDEVESYIEYLEVEDYWKGPEEDDKPYNDYCWWFFAKEIPTPMGRPLFYIKIRVENRRRNQVICLSFHEARYPVNFPYKGS